MPAENCLARALSPDFPSPFSEPITTAHHRGKPTESESFASRPVPYNPPGWCPWRCNGYSAIAGTPKAAANSVSKAASRDTRKPWRCEPPQGVGPRVSNFQGYFRILIAVASSFASVATPNARPRTVGRPRCLGSSTCGWRKSHRPRAAAGLAVKAAAPDLPKGHGKAADPSRPCFRIRPRD